MKLSYTVLLVVVAMMAASTAFAAPVAWLVDPTFDAQRDAYWSFTEGVSSTSWGIAEYNGPDDAALKGGDSYTIAGGWNVFGPYFGIDNSNGTAVPPGGNTFVNFNNWRNDNPLKYVWFQYDVLAIGGNPALPPSIAGAGGTPSGWGEVASLDLGDGWSRHLYQATIIPNPDYETVGFFFPAPAGSIRGIDNVRFATACVPEPGLIGLVSLGVLGVLARRKK